MSDFSLFDKPQGPKKWVRTRELASKNGFWGAKSRPKSQPKSQVQTQSKKSKVETNLVQSNLGQSTVETKPEIEYEQSNTNDSWDD